MRRWRVARTVLASAFAKVQAGEVPGQDRDGKTVYRVGAISFLMKAK